MTTALARTGAWVRGLQGWQAFLFAWISGGLSALAFAPVYCFPLLLLGYTGLVLLLDGESRIDRCRDRSAQFRRAGLGVRIRPVPRGAVLDRLRLHGRSGRAWLADAVRHRLPDGGGSHCFPRSRPGCPRSPGARTVRASFVFAVAFGLVEWLRGHIFTGFPWNIRRLRLGCVARDPAIRVRHRRLWPDPPDRAFRRVAGRTLPFAAAMAVAGTRQPRCSCCSGSAARFALRERRRTSCPASRLRLVQPDIPQAEKSRASSGPAQLESSRCN